MLQQRLEGVEGISSMYMTFFLPFLLPRRSEPNLKLSPLEAPVVCKSCPSKRQDQTVVKAMGSTVQLDSKLALPFTTYMPLGVLFHLSESPFPTPQNEDNNGPFLTGLL